MAAGMDAASAAAYHAGSQAVKTPMLATRSKRQKHMHSQKRRPGSLLGGVSLEHCHAPHATDTPRQPL